MPIVLAASVENAGVLLSLFIILAFAKIMAEIFERLRQPAVVGEILAGVIIVSRAVFSRQYRNAVKSARF